MTHPHQVVHAAWLIRDELPRLLGERAAEVDARIAELLGEAPDDLAERLIAVLRGYPETRRWLRAYLGRPDGEKSPAVFAEAPPPPEPPAAERRITIWVGDEAGDPPRLRVGQRVPLRVRVGRPVDASLVDPADATVRDVPPGGLNTSWSLHSRTVELHPGDRHMRTSFADGIWSAHFDLRIPQRDDSDMVTLLVVPTVAECRVDVVVRVGAELYRQLDIRLDATADAVGELSPATVRSDVALTPLGHANLQPSSEWQTAPGRLNISVGDRIAHVSGDVPEGWVQTDVPWAVPAAQIAGPIMNARGALERFRSRWDAYLDDVDHDDLERRLRAYRPPRSWTVQPAWDDDHDAKWHQVAASPELRELADAGHALYESFFGRATPLRDWLDRAPGGQRITISWLNTAGGGWQPDVPWGLMYLPAVPLPGHAVDPGGFAGLRFRLDYWAYASVGGSKALGALAFMQAVHALYWCQHPEDPVAVEAGWQRRRLAAAWPNQLVLPGEARPPRSTLLDLLNGSPTPVHLLYLYCHCTVGRGNEPVLRFGDSREPEDMITRAELGSAPLADRPLVFANACTTSASDPYIANELEATFLSRRDCRAFLGTESKVPARLASRFAAVFFHFLFRQVDGQMVAAGEAAAQARRFLWSQYANLGGLFYSYVNQYELFVADDTEVSAHRVVG